MAFNQRLIVVQIPINAREKRKRKKRSFAHFVFNFCSFRFCDYNVFSYGLGQIAAVRSGEMSEEYAFTTLGADPPKNQGWIYFDTCKGKVNSLKLAMRLNKVILQNADFEIYVEHPKDGSSKVWYRLT